MKQVKMVIPAAIAAMIFLPPTALNGGETAGQVSVRQVEDIFFDACTRCHAGANPAAALSLEPGAWLEETVNVASRQKPNLRLIDIRNPEKSYLVMKIVGSPEIVKDMMPKKGQPLNASQVEVITTWIHGLSGKSAEGAAVAPEERTPAPALNSVIPATRLVHLHTTTTLRRGEGLFRVSHRFIPPADSGHETFYGIDGPAIVFLEMGYGISDQLEITAGRSNASQAVTLSLTWAPVTFANKDSGKIAAALTGGFTVNTLRYDNDPPDRWKFHLGATLSIAPFTDLALMLSPMVVSNVNHWMPDSRSTLALGMGLRYRFFRQMAVVFEFTPVLAGYRAEYMGWGVGIEYPIGGHVFQVFVLNTSGLIPDQFIAGGDLNIRDGDFRFGFSIHRTF